jgi:hypothetical protein
VRSTQEACRRQCRMHPTRPHSSRLTTDSWIKVDCLTLARPARSLTNPNVSPARPTHSVRPMAVASSSALRAVVPQLCLGWVAHHPALASQAHPGQLGNSTIACSPRSLLQSLRSCPVCTRRPKVLRSLPAHIAPSLFDPSISALPIAH